MDALNVALLQLVPSETSWYTSTGQLQLVSLAICEMARDTPVATVVVTNTDDLDPLQEVH